MRRSGNQRAFLILTLVTCLFAWAGSAHALTDEEIFRQFGFNFINPGARALGLGGAFVAISDDPTAAQSNPAGLTLLSGPSFFGEYRVIDQDTQVFVGESGSLEVNTSTGERDLPFLGVTAVSEVEQVSEPTFVSFAYPFRLGSVERTLTLALSRQIVLSQDRSLSSGSDVTESRFSFDTFPNTVSGGMVEAYSVSAPVSGTSSTEIVYWNLGVALEVHPDFSFGLTVTQATLDLQMATSTQVVDPLELFLDPTHPRLPSDPTSDVYRTAIDGSDESVAYTIGIHWHPNTVFAGDSSPWGFGAVFRKGADFSVMESTFLNDVPLETFQTSFVVPDRYGVGLSYSTPLHWMFTAEYERIEYSDMMKGFRSGMSFLTSGLIEDAYGIDPEGSIEYTIDDAGVPRVGVEYLFSPFGGSKRLAVRAGYYLAPDDQIRMTSFNSDDPDVNNAYLTAFGGGEETNHVTVGAGFDIGRSSIQIAGDFSDDATQVVGSYTFTMGEPAR